MPTIETPLQGTGSWNAQLLTLTPDLAEELKPFREVWFLEGETHRYTGLLLQTPNAEGMTIGGRLLPYWLGFNREGPVVRKRRLFSGRNKIANEAFSFDPLPDLYWQRAEDSEWVISSGLARVNANPDRDDPLIYEERFPVEPGDQLRAEADVSRSGGSVGRLRLRQLYHGLFKHPNLAPALSGWTLPADGITFSGGKLVCGPIAQRQHIVNGDFANDFDDWDFPPAVGSGWSTQEPGLFGAKAAFFSPADEGDGSIKQGIPTATGSQRYRLRYWRLAFPGSDYEISVLVSYIPEGETELTFSRVNSIRAKDVFETDTWVREDRDISLPAIDSSGPRVEFRYEGGGESGNTRIDGVRFHQLTGNRRRAHWGSLKSVTPGRAYRVRAKVEADPSLTEGRIWFQVELRGAGRPNQIVEGSAWQYGQDQDEELHVLEMSVTPPSGYDQARWWVVAEDVAGGSYRVSEPLFQDSDASTLVRDTVISNTSAHTAVLQVTAPSGSEEVEWMVVAESEGQGWRCTRAHLRHVNVPIATIGSVAAELLNHPDGGALPLTLGTVHDSSVPIARDWIIVDQTHREILDDLVSIYAPGREWEIAPDGALNVVGADSGYYQDSAVFVYDNDPLAATPQTEQTAESLVTDVDVMGAERSRGTVVGEATAPPTFTDWRGKPVRRRTVVEDASVDHPELANAVASEEIEDRNRERRSVTVEIGDWRAYGELRVGQRMAIWSPRAGVEDPSNPQPWGPWGTAFPEMVRVTDMSHELGPGWRCLLRKGESDFLDITSALVWERTRATIQAGDPAPSFYRGTAGAGGYAHFLRLRTARARSGRG